jgi:hypothetical protein
MHLSDKTNASNLSRQLITATGGLNWVKENTAMLIVHGIGNQQPLETLDSFGRGLIRAYETSGAGRLTIEHHLAKKSSPDGSKPWFDNFIRIKAEGRDEPYIDLYEYYWAKYTEDQATLNDLRIWLRDVVSGAKKFYCENAALAQQVKDKSIFIVDGKLDPERYELFLGAVGNLLFAVDAAVQGFLKFVSYVPFIGPVATSWLESYLELDWREVLNVVNEVAIYNTMDARSEFFDVRERILDGAVNAVRYLMEPDEGGIEPRYPKILLAGHSLGSQIIFDSINRLDHLVNEGMLNGFTAGGMYRQGKEERKAVTLFAGLVTFGSPLDKIAFFFREQADRGDYIRAQLLNNFHSFKQRKWLTDDQSEIREHPIAAPFPRLFDAMKWNNYFDRHDYVSGSLDYYQGVTNVNCEFKKGWFTHSNYWDCDKFYEDFWRDMVGK